MKINQMNQVKSYRNIIHKAIYSMICLLLAGLYLSCGETDDAVTPPLSSIELKPFQSIIEAGTIPSDLANYDDISKTIFSNYTTGATVVARYVTTNGDGDGSSWTNATNNIQKLLDGITDADNNKVYVILVASGTYKPGSSYVMKNHVALIGGFTAMNSGSYDRSGETRLDGDNNKKVFNNDNNGLDNTALLYGVTITNGRTTDNGAGMYNYNSSPTLMNVTFSGNTADQRGGGMYNANSSSPTLMNITFSGNTAGYGSGMYNSSSSPTLMNVTFSGNTASSSGGGMYNEGSSFTLMNVTFSGNTADDNGGGMYNSSSSPTLMNVTFSGNTANRGGGIYNSSSSSPTLMNVTFSGNTANQLGGGMANYNSSSPTLMNVTFSGNTVNLDGGGMYNEGSSSPTLMNVTFSGNTAGQYGGGMYNYNSSSPTLMNVTFSGNTVNLDGGGIYHDGEGKHLTLINTILWKNNNGNIHLLNDRSATETVNLYYSLIEGGTNASTAATGIRLYRDDTTAYPISINGESFITNDPGLGTLANNGGEVNTISIGDNSPAKDKGVYMRGVKAGNTYPAANLYYSTNNTAWFSDPGLTNPVADLLGNADDLTATDARGYNRVGRPDMGAYEAGGTP